MTLPPTNSMFLNSPNLLFWHGTPGAKSSISLICLLKSFSVYRMCLLHCADASGLCTEVYKEALVILCKLFTCKIMPVFDPFHDYFTGVFSEMHPFM